MKKTISFFNLASGLLLLPVSAQAQSSVKGTVKHTMKLLLHLAALLLAAEQGVRPLPERR
jgi:hypothetical protein